MEDEEQRARRCALVEQLRHTLLELPLRDEVALAVVVPLAQMSAAPADER